MKAMEALEEVKTDMKREGMTSMLGLQKRGKPASIELVEMGMCLMSRGLSAEQGRCILRDVCASAYPSLKENVDYRIPAASIKCMKKADGTHLLHDASTRKGTSVFSTCARSERGGAYLDHLVDYCILKNGEAKAEARAIANAITTDVNGGLHAGY